MFSHSKAVVQASLTWHEMVNLVLARGIHFINIILIQAAILARFLHHFMFFFVSAAELHGVDIDPLYDAILALHQNADSDKTSNGIVTLALLK